MNQLGKSLIGIGLVLVVLGVLALVLPKHWRFFRLPGDIVVERPGMSFYFPIVSMILFSVVLSLVFWLVGVLRR